MRRLCTLVLAATMMVAVGVRAQDKADQAAELMKNPAVKAALDAREDERDADDRGRDPVLRDSGAVVQRKRRAAKC